MKLQRRQLLRSGLHAALLTATSRIALAQPYPARTARLIIGFPPGGTTDFAARLIAQWLGERLGQQFIVENRPGANTNLAVEAVFRAPADGYTLGTIGMSNVLNATLYRKLNFDLNRDLAMIAGLIISPLVLEVHPAVPANNVPELISYAKANPGRISMASFGTGSISHVAGELFKMTAGIDMLHVPYRGSAPMVTDLLGGQVQAAFDNLPASIEHIRAGKLRALAVTTRTRSDALPQIPTLAEFLPGYDATAFLGLCATRNTPADIILKLNNEINAGLLEPKIAARMAELGGAPLVLSPAQFSKLINEETEKWARVIQRAGIKAE
jgi:tripartite-type tricarboxylate transporter receptor subunit TctC